MINARAEIETLIQDHGCALKEVMNIQQVRYTDLFDATCTMSLSRMYKLAKIKNDDKAIAYVLSCVKQIIKQVA
jgi:hypothetical protein